MESKKILLVDDADTVLMIEKMILKKNYDLVIAKNGEEAITSALSERPDLILLDVVMPKMDGFEACKRIRHEPTTSCIPIIMVTTRGEEHNIETAYASGCNDFVSKPINGLELLSKVKNYLDQ